MIWSRPPSSISLPTGSVHLWRLNLNVSGEELEALAALLDDEERGRAERFLRAEHGHKFSVAHGRLRAVLSHYHGTAPDELRFNANEFGKPSLATKNGSPSIEFNLSHSGQWALIGVTASQAIGVDVEQSRPETELEKIARRYFSPEEVDRLFALPENTRRAAFYECWSRKEAYIKARGEGLSLGLDRFGVAFGPDDPPRLVWSAEGESELSQWAFLNVDVAEGYAGACVVKGEVTTVKFWEAGES